jgi:hypothetical protein
VLGIEDSHTSYETYLAHQAFDSEVILTNNVVSRLRIGAQAHRVPITGLMLSFVNKLLRSTRAVVSMASVEYKTNKTVPERVIQSVHRDEA